MASTNIINPEKIRKRTYNTTDTSSETSTHLYSYEKLNENTDITSEKALTAETHSRTIFSLDDKLSDLIQKICIKNLIKRHVDFRYFC